MIIACPNCGARYRLPADVAGDRAMRCAACDHRWVPDAGVMLADVPAPAIGPVVDNIPPPAEPPASERVVLKTLVAIVVGGALAIGAAALWAVRIDPSELAAEFPMIEDRIAAFFPAALPLAVTVSARTTPLSSGDRLLEIKGQVRNTGDIPITLPDFEVRLAGADGTVRRWRITASVPVLAPGASAGFASTATGFPAGATTVGVRSLR